MSNFEFKTLENTALVELKDCFNEGFSDYAIKFEVTEDYLRTRWQIAKVDFALSGGAFLGEKLVGMVIIAADKINGRMQAHNAATCVIPAARGNNLTARIFDFLFPKFQNNQVQHLQLEVLKGNDKAIKVYERIGLKIERELTYLTKEKFTQNSNNQKVIIQKIASNTLHFDANKLPQTRAWEVHQRALQHAPDSHDVYIATLNDEVVGNAVMVREMNWISHIYVEPKHRKKDIGRALLHTISQEYDYLRAVNIDTRNEEAIAFFKALGFTENVHQFEMHMDVV